MFFAQGLGGAVFLAVSQSIFIQELVRRLPIALPAASAQVLVGIGATDLRAIVPAEQLPAVLGAYNGAITTTFFVAVGTAALSVIPALGLEWRIAARYPYQRGRGRCCQYWPRRLAPTDRGTCWTCRGPRARTWTWHDQGRHDIKMKNLNGISEHDREVGT